MTNELATVNINTMLSQDAGTMLCSIEADPSDRETMARVFKALNDPTHRVADFINKEIPVENILIEAADILNEETGEIDRVPRVVLITPNGESYQAVSMGMFNAVKNAFRCYGKAPWKPALTFAIKQKPVKNGSMLTADVY
jgi:hypothetical protein